MSLLALGAVALIAGASSFVQRGSALRRVVPTFEPSGSNFTDGIWIRTGFVRPSPRGQGRRRGPLDVTHLMVLAPASLQQRCRNQEMYDLIRDLVRVERDGQIRLFRTDSAGLALHRDARWGMFQNEGEKAIDIVWVTARTNEPVVVFHGVYRDPGLTGRYSVDLANPDVMPIVRGSGLGFLMDRALRDDPTGFVGHGDYDAARSEAIVSVGSPVLPAPTPHESWQVDLAPRKERGSPLRRVAPAPAPGPDDDVSRAIEGKFAPWKIEPSSILIGPVRNVRGRTRIVRLTDAEIQAAIHDAMRRHEDRHEETDPGTATRIAQSNPRSGRPREVAAVLVRGDTVNEPRFRGHHVVVFRAVVDEGESLFQALRLDPSILWFLPHRNRVLNEREAARRWLLEVFEEAWAKGRADTPHLLRRKGSGLRRVGPAPQDPDPSHEGPEPNHRLKVMFEPLVGKSLGREVPKTVLVWFGGSANNPSVRVTNPENQTLLIAWNDQIDRLLEANGPLVVRMNEQAAEGAGVYTFTAAHQRLIARASKQFTRSGT